jgi:pimeloyl-ACP methyl ester carboxylesterase
VDVSAEGRALAAAVTGGLEPTRLCVAAGRLVLGGLVFGEPGRPTAVLVHGNGGHAHWWDPLVAALAPGWRLAVPDLRGHGESDWAEPPRYRLADFAADLDAVIGGLAADRVALVGHSMGGRVAAWYAAAHPGRISGLALLDTRLGGVPPGASAAFRASVAGRRTGRTYPTRAAAMAAFRFVPDEPGVDPAVVADLAHHAVVERARGEWTYRFDRGVLALDGDGAGDMLGTFAAVRCPIALLAGAASWVMDGGEIARLRAVAPRARVHVFPGAHHFLVARPGPVGAALRAFLESLR